MSRRLRLGVIFGGRSAEHEVSVVSAQNVMAAADPERFEVIPLGVTKQGVWLTPQETTAQLARPDPPYRKRLETDEASALFSRPAVLAALAGLDVAFPLIHGVNGEDGTLQGLLELAGVPYVGAGVPASAVGMDKSLQKPLFRQAGLPVAEFCVVSRARWEREPSAVSRDVEALGFPCFVKPANGGSSLGITKVRSREDLAGAFVEAFRFDRKLLVEESVSGREIECAVLGNDEPEASPLGEILPRREFYDYAAKYLEDTTDLVAPADIPPETAERIQKMALAAYRAVDCAGMARVDFFLTPSGPVVNEINTIPGFTSISMYPRLWQLAGLTYTALISRLVDLALERFAEARTCG